MRGNLLFVLLILSCVNNVTAQSNYYLFENKTATYTELSNDTTVPAAFLSSGDIWMFELVGDNFSFFDKTYTIDNVKKHIVFSNNGFMRVEDDSTFIVVDAAFTLIDSIDNTTRLSYIVEGTPGNKILKVQWKNLKLANGQAGNFLNYQVWLYQKTGIFEIYYGPSSSNNQSGFTTANGPNIGLFYSLQTFTKMFEKIWVNGAPGTYTLDSAKTVSFSAVSGVPVNGTMFRYVPKKVKAGINTIHKTGMKVYPNPASTELNIQLKEPVPGEAKVKLYDLQGRKVFEDNVEVSSGTINIPVEKISNGLYELKLLAKDTEFSQTVEIKH